MTCVSVAGTSSRVVPPVRAAVVLAGGVGRRAHALGNGRGVLMLPVSRDADVMDVWLQAFGSFAASAGRSDLDVRFAIDTHAAEPSLDDRAVPRGLSVRVERDDAEFRGTAGTLQDVTDDLEPDDLVLVAVASQLPRTPILQALAAIGGGGEGVCLSRSGRSDLASLFVLRRRRLEAVPRAGFFDLKEQLRMATTDAPPLPYARLPSGAFAPIRTRREYLDAVAAACGGSASGVVPGVSPHFAERWQATFRLISDGAHVAPTANVQDSVILPGATVEGDAHVVRSVVCSGARVRAGSVVVNSLVTSSGTHEL